MTSSTQQVETVPDGMVLVPGGTFAMGADDGYPEERPVHEVTVAAFHMDIHPVTNAQYLRFCDETGRSHPTPPRWPEMLDYLHRFPDHPVININHADAVAYAAWSDKRLPTEAEWEWAAGGGRDGAVYPWGDELPGAKHAAFAGRDTPVAWRDPFVATGSRRTTAVGSFPANGYGLYDLAGNVWEWCDNWFYQYPWEDLDQRQVEEGWGLQRVVRGGAWYSPARDLRVSRRLRVHGGVGGNGTGFRCVQDIPGLPEPAQTAPGLPPRSDPDPHAWNDVIFAHPQRMERGIELCLGCGPDLTDDEAARIAALGFTSVEQYVHWGTVENEGEGIFDFSHWDAQVEILKRHGLKWVPFLIAGPAYTLPDWFRDSIEHRGAVCLEHGLPSKIQSIFDRSFDRHVERYLAAFAARYRDADVLEALLLGITGDFGEAIYPVTGTMWTQVTPGPYHTHPGYWCGDPLAREQFREAILQRYGGNLGQVNAAWDTDFLEPGEITLPMLELPDRIDGFRADEPTAAGVYPIASPHDRRRWLDFIDWYRGAMNALAELWMQAARRSFPNHPIYLCTGGDAPPWHGAHFGDQCRIAAASNGGVRITNEASNYPHNFAITRWVTSAGRYHGAYTGIEPAGGVNEFGLTGRIFNAVTSGAKNLHFYAANIVHHLATVEAWQETFDAIRPHTPVLDVAFYHPDTAIMLRNVSTHDVFEQVGYLRDLMDIEYVDDDMIEGGILDRFRVLVIACAPVIEQATLDRFAAWHEAGGILVIVGDDSIQSVEGQAWTLNTSAGRVVRVDRFLGEPAQDDGVATRLREGLADCGYRLIDGRLDNVFVSQVEDRLLVLNHGVETVSRQLGLPGGEMRSIRLPANSITEVPLT